MNPRELCEGLVESARAAGADEAEGFFGDHTTATIDIRDQAVESLVSATQRGVGVRALVGGRTGYAYSTDLDRAALDDIAGAAVRLAREATPDPDRALPAPGEVPLRDLAIYDPDLPEVPAESKIELLRAVERAARASDPRVKDTDLARYVDGYGITALANSRGFCATYQSSMCYALISVIARADGESQRGYGYTFGHGLKDLSPALAADRASFRAVATLGGRQIPTQKVLIIMEPEVVAELLGSVAGALSAESILKGRSMFLGKEGTRVAADAVTLVDQGDLPGGLGSSPFDGEGVATGRTELIQRGMLRGWLHNAYTARRMHTRSTGNASRGSFRGAPGIGPTNFWLEPGSENPEALRGRVKRGLQVVLSKNVGGINVVNGDYSVGASGLWIEDGEVAHPVSQVTIAGNMLDMLNHVVAVGSDLRWIPGGGAIGVPTVHFEGMTVAGS